MLFEKRFGITRILRNMADRTVCSITYTNNGLRV